MRAFLLASILLASSLAAQTSFNLGGSVPDSGSQEYLVRVDHGASATAVDVTLTVTTTGASGLLISVIDLDSMALLLPGSIDLDVSVGAGTATVNMPLPARTGTHDLVVVIETESNGPASPYTGMFSVSAGTTTQQAAAFWPYIFLGIRVHFGRVIEYARGFGGTGIITHDFTVNFGPAAHTTDFATLIEAGSVTQGRVLDMTAMPVDELALYPAMAGDVSESDTHLTASHSGNVTFRLEFTRNGLNGFVNTVVVLGPDVVFVSATDSLAPSGGGGKKGNDCTAGAGGPAGAMLAGVMGLWALRRRKRA